MTLTVRQIESLKAREKPYKAYDALGLYLQVSTIGSKAWRCNYKKDGEQATKSFGMYPAVTLAEARLLNTAWRGKKDEVLVSTFSTIADLWTKKKQATLKNGKHQIQIETTLKTFVYPTITSHS